MLVAVHLMHIPNSANYFMMERPSGYHPDNSRSIAGILTTEPFGWKTHVASPNGLFCAGHVQMSDGRIAVVGGHTANAGWPSGLNSIRIFDPSVNTLVNTTVLNYNRWYVRRWVPAGLGVG